jgi:hypothetical protein
MHGRLAQTRFNETYFTAFQIENRSESGWKRRTKSASGFRIGAWETTLTWKAALPNEILH